MNEVEIDPVIYISGEEYYLNDVLAGLGITADQLKIARALDRNKVEKIYNELSDFHDDQVSHGFIENSRFVLEAMKYIPTFDETKVKNE